MIKKVIRDKLIATSAVADTLATYAFTSGSAATPAVFTGRKIPDDAEYPAIFISVGGGGDFSCRAQTGAEISVEINVFDDRDQSDAALEALALAVWNCLNRAEIGSGLADAGYQDWGCYADYPQAIGGENTFPGYLVRVTARVLETP